jgi:hypothetical protein
MTSCKLCRRPAIAPPLDFGAQSLSNRYLRAADEAQPAFPLSIGVCVRCGTAQLLDLAPPEELRPRFDWLSYNEPESHLDDVASLIRRLPGVGPNSIAGGLGYKDESTLRRLRNLGLAGVWLADDRTDLGVDLLQRNLTPAATERLVRVHGRPDVFVLRHLLEHAHDIHAVLTGLRRLVAPGGHLVLEVPDAVRALERCDYSTVWEEHVFYFTPATLRQCLALAGFEVVRLESYHYSLENSLVAVARPAWGPQPLRSPREVRVETERMRRFIDRYPGVRGERAASLRRGRTALLGAGHHGAAFLNLFRLGTAVDFVVDDDPHKHGLYMPGSRLPILPSSQLVERAVNLCLMTVRPEVEAAVVRKNEAFAARGGRLASIFPDSSYALQAA